MKKGILLTGFILIAAAIWYLFIKPHDYQVSFKAKTFPGAIDQTIKAWGKSKKEVKLLSQERTNQLTQSLQFKDSTHIYQWQVTPIHDSLSLVKVYATDPNHSLKNKLTIPFTDTDFEKRTRKTVLDFGKTLTEHIKNFKVTIVGEATPKSNFCACTTQKKTQLEKADGMMRDYPFLSHFLLKNQIKLNGTPFIEITDWQQETDSIQFKFCFPIVQNDLLPKHPELEFRNFYGRKSLKAIYNGNYITSDRAWYALLDYAEQHDIAVSPKPLEVFYNNPNQGNHDAIRWKAEIFMPIKE